MYMYYLLGYRIIRMSDEKVCQELDKQRDVNESWGGNGTSKVYTALDSHVKKKVLRSWNWIEYNKPQYSYLEQ